MEFYGFCYDRIGSGIQDVMEVERHPFFANIPFRFYEEKKVNFYK
jgi:hypothetical protein